MAFAYIYPPPLGYDLTYLSETFPEHHHGQLENARHKIGHAMHEFFLGQDSASHKPRADVRETLKKYYLDIELPGLNTTEGLSLKWFNRRTLILSAKVERPELKDEEIADASAEHSTEDAKGQSKPENPIHILKSERQIGQYFRMFEFSADVDHESMKSKLQNGLLRIELDKKPHEHVQPKEVKVEHIDS